MPFLSATTGAPALPTTRVAGVPPREARARVCPYGVCARVVSASPGANPVASKAMMLPAVAVSAVSVVRSLAARVVDAVVPRRLISNSVARSNDGIRRTGYLTVRLTPSTFAARSALSPAARCFRFFPARYCNAHTGDRVAGYRDYRTARAITPTRECRGSAVAVQPVSTGTFPQPTARIRRCGAGIAFAPRAASSGCVPTPRGTVGASAAVWAESSMW